MIWLPPGVSKPKPKRNDPCECGSGKKYKKCCDLVPERPPCSVKGCEEPVHFFLSPSVEGYRTGKHYWVSCKGHVQDISASAAQVGMDVDIIPFDSLQGEEVAPKGLEVVREDVEEASVEPELEA